MSTFTSDTFCIFYSVVLLSLKNHWPTVKVRSLTENEYEENMFKMKGLHSNESDLSGRTRSTSGGMMAKKSDVLPPLNFK